MLETNSTVGWRSSGLVTASRDLATFLRSPRQQIVEQRGSHGLADLGWLFALNCLIVMAIAAVIFPLMIALEIEMSGNMAELFNRPAWQIFGIVVVIGPIVEELMFRSWLSGLPRLLIPFAGLIAWVGGSQLISRLGLGDSESIATLGFLGIILITTLVGVIKRWQRAAPGWFLRWFPVIFWIQAILFSLMHLFNYDGGNPAMLLPFVLPQLVGGLIWGYARLRHGWWANMAMHMAYNLIAVSGVLFVMLSGGELTAP